MYLSRLSLRQLLIVPYVVLVIVAAAIIGMLSYGAGRNAVNSLSNYVLSETVSRIFQAINKHIAGSETVLQTAFPPDMHAPASIVDNLDVLRTRLWLATSIHRNPSNYAYYGDRKGHFVGLYRHSENEAELRLRSDGNSSRSIYRFSGINGELNDPVIEQAIFEPRDRPWYEAGKSSLHQTWTSIYIDFSTLELVSTRARRVNNSAGEFEGVVATDLSMDLLNQFLKELKLTKNGFAFIVEPDGNLVATSRGPHIIVGDDDNNMRLNAADSSDRLITATYESVKALTEQSKEVALPATGWFKGPDGEIIQTGYHRLRDAAGLDWIIAVAVPRSDFMHDMTGNVKRTVILALLACVLIACIGLTVLNLISKDLRQLANAARLMGDGVLDTDIPTQRLDEIGILANAFSTMQTRLLTDRLTGIPNREAWTRIIEERIIDQRRQATGRSFAVLFIDLNGFKAINDRLGHEVGDKVLVEIAQRLDASLNADDLAARFGGDEFIVLLNTVSNRKDVESRRDAIESLLAAPLQTLDTNGVKSDKFNFGAAIGIAICPDDGVDLNTLIKTADKDMYERKNLVKARIHVEYG